VVIRPLLLLASVALLAGCGGSGGDDPEATTTSAAAPPASLTLTLDFVPNAVHSGLYLAQQRGLFAREGVDLRIRVPGTGSDNVKALSTGRTDLAIMDIHDVALAQQEGARLVAVGALVQRPLASLVAAPDVARPRDLEGRRVGVTGLPSDDAAVDQIVRGDGGDPRRVRRVTIGFESVKSVLSGRVQAATAFWNAEGVALRIRRPRTRIFRLDEFGAPRYPELLLVTTPDALRRERPVIERFLRAAAQGTQEAATASTAQSAAVVEALSAGAGEQAVDPQTAADQLAAVRPALLDPDGEALTIDRAAMRRWAAWETRVGITRRAPDVDALVWSGAPGR
jgi:NitT/TauT family transport system substrate-binding protein/putative hydroxymethylpyrimidine transport system substrate-binding protein